MKWLLLPPLLYVLLWVILALRARIKPGLKVWHRANLRELTAADYPLGMTFEELREKEEEVFARLESEVYDRVLEEDRLAYNRYFSGSNVNPDRAGEIHDFPLDYNRSYEVLPAGEARGAVLLVHGLTDSPYSMRAIADIFRASDRWRRRPAGSSRVACCETPAPPMNAKCWRSPAKRPDRLSSSAS